MNLVKIVCKIINIGIEKRQRIFKKNKENATLRKAFDTSTAKQMLVITAKIVTQEF